MACCNICGAVYTFQKNLLLNGESKLIDMFLCFPELHQNLKELFTIVSKNHEYFGKPSTTANEKAAAAENDALFTKKIPFYSQKYPSLGKCTSHSRPILTV